MQVSYMIYKPPQTSYSSTAIFFGKQKNHMNRSNVLEKCLAEMLVQDKHCAWNEAEYDAIESYIRRIEACGIFSDGLRTF